MSKELIERLRVFAGDPVLGGVIEEAADLIEELERDLLNLVCRIHRDGGHYIAKYGEAKAIADADTVAAQNNADLDALQADNARLRDLLAWVDKYVGCAISGSIKEALSTTPEQSLAEYRNKVIEECATRCDPKEEFAYSRNYLSGITECAEAIRAMKDQP